MLFCDNLELYKNNITNPDSYPWNVLFAEKPAVSDLQKITNDPKTESRIKILAYNKLLEKGIRQDRKQLLCVIVEDGLERGLDVLAAFSDGSARYINQKGELIVWETKNNKSTELTNKLFDQSLIIVKNIGPWNKPRKLYPSKGYVRLSFLASDGLYFGEGPIKLFYNDKRTIGALTAATEFKKLLIEKC